MAERSFKQEVKKLKLEDGETFTGEGILAITKALLEAECKNNINAGIKDLRVKFMF